ncbi:MAG TPA: tRNA uridine-5-carboxymethylaminomethyl(34) synthesis GTPase MnmE, partial [Hyphomicrobiales bacterium]|nr:tRNA uridine-5-carboxymethylaminomethyl(34) synthesis GTPase MnmE [Hyphomicrobiales bacterium]
MTASDTIFALSSGPGRAGVAVFRISGPQAARALKALAGGLPEPRRASLRALRDSAAGGEIDRGLVLWLPGPESFTGEDMGELQVHGSRAVAAALTSALAALEGFRLAEPGEFARRAFENG